MESEKHLQLIDEARSASEKNAVEIAGSAAITTADRWLAQELRLDAKKDSSDRRAQMDPDYRSRRDSRQALMKASKTLLPIEEICEGLANIADVSEQLDQQVMLLEDGRKMEHKARRLECLRAAHLAPRCEHIKPDGMRCGSPAIGGQKFCFFHNLSRNNAVEFPVVEDGRGLQVAILRVCERLANGTISAANAKVLLEGLAMAAENARSIARQDGEL